ncbi:15203_t:CDS:2 [Entrophospora sp. SA101]|nr:15203_t:CDS:2 [Entrophospora sp. SA101]
MRDNDSNISQDIREIAEKLIENKKTDVNKVNSLWNKANKNKKKKQYVVPEMSHLFPNEDVPMQANGSVNILEVVKSVVRTFDKNTIAQGSFRSYKSSNHLCIDSKKRAKVPRESVYDAEMYRILHNWLVKVHGFEITGQWHLESICADGDFHHFYCDLTIKKHDATNPVAILELLATVSQPKLDNHFEQVFKYAEQLCPLEVWIVHFSREDAVVTDPYWPCNELQDKGLNVIHLWHNKEFTNVRMSSRSLDAIGPDDFPEVELSESTITPIPSAHISKSSGLGDLPKTQGFNSDFSDNDEVNNWSATYSDNDDEAGDE